MEHGDQSPASSQLALLEAFLNTRGATLAMDRFGTPESMQQWLSSHRLVAPHSEFDEADRRRLVEVRDALVQLVASHGGPTTNRRAVMILNEAARRIRLAVRLHAEDGYRLVARGVGVERPVGDLLVGVLSAMTAGTWGRLKICGNETCGQAFIDESRNRSARWCSMERCGNRMKGRAYRRRQASLRAAMQSAEPAAAAAS